MSEVVVEAAKDAGLAVATGSLKVVEAAGHLAKSTGVVATKAGEIAEVAANTGNHAAVALSNVAEAASNITGVANSITARANNSLIEANKRRQEIEAQKTAILQNTRGKETDVETQKKLQQLELESQRIAAKQRAQQIEHEKEIADLAARQDKINKDLENAKELSDAQGVSDAKTIYIAAKNFGYKSTSCVLRGWVKSSFPGYGFYYMIEYIKNPTTSDMHYVEFNKEGEPTKEFQNGYYVKKDDKIYKLVIMVIEKTSNTFMSGTSTIGIGKLRCVDYIPSCFADSTDSPQRCNSATDTTEYTLQTKKVWFKIPHTGGRKTKKNKKAKTKKGRKAKRQTKKRRH
jgi:hypothetical protein